MSDKTVSQPEQADSASLGEKVEAPEVVADLHAGSVDAPSPLAVPDFYYDGSRYYYRDAAGVFYTMDEKSLRRRLFAHGFFVQIGKSQDVGPFITVIQDQHAVRYAGPLAGYSAGIHELRGGRKFLVTETTEPRKPSKGAWASLRCGERVPAAF